MKAWQLINDPCMHCGDAAAVFTEAPEDMCADGDAVICLGCLCHGSIQADAETAPHVVWHNERPGECDCGWCKQKVKLEEVRRADK